MSSFDGAGQQAGLEIWRIEDFEAVPYDTAKYGQFHVGDSYVVLKTNERNGQLSWSLHFWIGSESSQDEYGAAALKTVELDDSLGGVPVQHREVQEHESSLFESYFKKGIKYLPGGVKSGFRHVDPDQVEKRLFRVKGKRNIRVKQLNMENFELNKGDCFILDLGKGNDVLVLVPPGARTMEKFRATQAANDIRDEDHSGDANVVIIDEYDGDASRFFEELGRLDLSLDSLPEASDDSDALVETEQHREVKLYKVANVNEEDDNSDVEITEVAARPLSQEMLKQEDCFILDTGSTAGVFAWIGRSASKSERVQAMKSAEKFVRQQNLPQHTRVERVVEFGEPSQFKQFFNAWSENNEINDQQQVSIGNRVYDKNFVNEKLNDDLGVDIASLHAENRRRVAKSAGEALGFMPDDGQAGTKTVYRIENFELVEQEAEKVGWFFAGDSYVIQYDYESDSGRPGHVIYFWQGASSSQDEKAASALHAVQLDDKLDGLGVQVRVVQGLEPRHFLRIFQGKMVVFKGGKASGFKNVRDRDEYDEDGTRLFRVRGLGEQDVRVVQVEEEALSLNSEDVFVLELKDKCYIWVGQFASESEKEKAQQILSVVCPDRDLEAVIEEGNEPDDFWNGLQGGKSDYQKHAYNPNKPLLKPRLFRYSISNGRVRIAEIAGDFEQTDLVSDDVMILDSGAEIYVWVGKDSAKEEAEKAFEVAKEYLSKDPTERDEKNTVIIRVKEGSEPGSFTSIFPSFN